MTYDDPVRQGDRTSPVPSRPLALSKHRSSPLVASRSCIVINDCILDERKVAKGSCYDLYLSSRVDRFK